MKKVLLVVGLAAVVVSCTKAKGEELLYNYQKESVKAGLNMDLEDLEFEIIEVKEAGTVTARDSAQMYKEKLIKFWFGEDIVKEEADTLSYTFVVSQMDTMQKNIQRIIELNIEMDQSYENYEYKRKAEEAKENQLEVLSWMEHDQKYSKNLDSVLSYKYLATYSINNPMLNNNKQTFDKYFYSNPEQTKFIKEEMVDDAVKIED